MGRKIREESFSFFSHCLPRSFAVRGVAFCSISRPRDFEDGVHREIRRSRPSSVQFRSINQSRINRADFSTSSSQSSVRSRLFVEKSNRLTNVNLTCEEEDISESIASIVAEVFCQLGFAGAPLQRRMIKVTSRIKREKKGKRGEKGRERVRGREGSRRGISGGTWFTRTDVIFTVRSQLRGDFLVAFVTSVARTRH